jgi:hypothetical protein
MRAPDDHVLARKESRQKKKKIKESSKYRCRHTNLALGTAWPVPQRLFRYESGTEHFI